VNSDHTPVLLHIPKDTIRRYTTAAYARGLIHTTDPDHVAAVVRNLMVGELIDAVHHLTPHTTPRQPNGAGQQARRSESRARNAGISDHTAAIPTVKGAP
jgi:hypothetical protein